MRSLDSRLQKIESELGVGDYRPKVVSPEEAQRRANFAQAAKELLATMAEEHAKLILADFEVVDGVRRILCRLTRNFIERVERHLGGDQRPLVLPPEVAAVYLHKPEWGLLFDRECLSCGYDVVECDGCLPAIRFAACPVCGGEYEPIEPGHGVRFSRFYRGWSKANPDKVA
jgi:hypothetical protein